MPKKIVWHFTLSAKITSDTENFIPRQFKVRKPSGSGGYAATPQHRSVSHNPPAEVTRPQGHHARSASTGGASKEIVANTDPDVLRIFVIRHGQTNENVQKILQGWMDTSLNPTGVEQAKKVAHAVKDIPFDAFLSSDLMRCRQTLQEIRAHHPEVPTEYLANLRERDMGECQGMFLLDALEKYGTAFRNLGEEKATFIGRVESEWVKFIQANPQLKNIAICTHGGVVTGFLNHLYQQGFTLSELLRVENLKVPFNTSVAVVDINRATGQGIIQTFGNTDHLGGQYEVKDQLLR